MWAVFCALLCASSSAVQGYYGDNGELRRITNSTPPPPAPMPWLTNGQPEGGGTGSKGYNCLVHPVPNNGASSTMRNGNKLCPFDHTSAVCTSTACYFYYPDAYNGRVCPARTCDALINQYCTGLNTAKKKWDYGCAVLKREGIGPYEDWLETNPYLMYANYTQVPMHQADGWPVSSSTTNPLMGGASGFELQFTLATDKTTFNAAKQTFINDLAGKLRSTPDDPIAVYIYVTSPTASSRRLLSSLAVIVQITRSLSTLKTKMDAQVSTKFGGTLGGFTVSSVSQTYKTRTSKCYGNHPDTLDQKAICPALPEQAGLLESRKAMSGVWSLPTGDFSHTGDLINAAAHFGCIFGLSCIIIMAAY